MRRLNGIYMLGMLLTTMIFVTCNKRNEAGGGLNPNISFLPASGLAGTVVTIKGKGFSADTSMDIVTFNGTQASVQWATDTSLLVTVPDSGTTGPVSVRVGSQQAKGGVYTYQSLSITAIYPASGPAGISDTITGVGLSYMATIESRQPAVFFNGKAATLVSASPTQLIVLVPDSAGVGPVTVSLGELKATGPVYNYLGIVSVSPLSGNVGTVLMINGGFGSNYNTATVTINGKQAVIGTASQTQLVVTVPVGDTTGPVAVHLNGQTLQGPVFTFVPPPTISSLTPGSGPAGNAVTIVGTGFSPVVAENAVLFNGTAAKITSVSAHQLVVTVPAGATSGPVVITVNGQTVTGPVFKVQPLGILSVAPHSGPPGTTVTITGFGFSTTTGQDLVYFNGTQAAVTSATATQLVVTAPAGFTDGPLSVAVGALTATGPVFSNLVPGVTTIAGGTVSPGQFSSPVGVAIDVSGNVYVADNGSNNIQKIAPDGTVTVFAGNLSGPTDLVFDRSGNLYVADVGIIRMFTPGGTMSTFASMPNGDQAWGIAIDGSGNIYVADQSDNQVVEFSSSGSQLSSTSYGQSSLYGVAVDASGNVYTCFYGPGVTKKGGSVLIQNSNLGPQGLAVDNSGNVFISDNYMNEIYSPSVNVSTPTIITGGVGGGYTDGDVGVAQFNKPVGIKVDSRGVIYVADKGNQAIRKIVLP